MRPVDPGRHAGLGQPPRGRRARGRAPSPGARSPARASPSRERCAAAICDPGGDMSHTLDELMRDSLDHCVKCTICETYCPVAAATPLFPGPKYVGPQAERYRGPGPSPDVSLDYCSSCGICTQVCPQGVKIAEINSQARARLKEDTRRPAARPADRAADARPGASAPRSRRSPTGDAQPGRRAALTEKTIGIHRKAPMPQLGRAHAARRGRAATGRRRKPDPARRRAHGRLLPRLRRRTTTSPTPRGRPSRCSSTTGSR